MRWYDTPVEIPVAVENSAEEWQQITIIYNIAIITLLAQDCKVIPITDMIECYSGRE